MAPELGIPYSIPYQLNTRSGNTGPEVPYLLDEIPMTSDQSGIAYSTRRLREDYVSGIAMRVVRQSDLAEQNIFYLPNGDLDVNAIANFCGTSDGRVTRWHNQAPENDPLLSVGQDLIQTTNSLRPTIYDGATQSVITENGIPTVKFQQQAANQGTYMSSSTTLVPGTIYLNDHTVSVVSNVITFEDVNPRLCGWRTNNFNWQVYAQQATTDLIKIGRRWGNTNRGIGNLRNSEYKSYSHRLLVSTTNASTNPDGYWNGTLFANNSTGPSANSALNTGAFHLGVGYNYISYYEGNNTNISEFIMYWNQDLTSDAADLNTNTNDYFKMY